MPILPHIRGSVIPTTTHTAIYRNFRGTGQPSGALCAAKNVALCLHALSSSTPGSMNPSSGMVVQNSMVPRTAWMGVYYDNRSRRDWTRSSGARLPRMPSIGVKWIGGSARFVVYSRWELLNLLLEVTVYGYVGGVFYGRVHEFGLTKEAPQAFSGLHSWLVWFAKNDKKK